MVVSNKVPVVENVTVIIMDSTLINLTKKLADEERKIKEYKSRIRIKGIISNKGITKSGNIRLIVKKGDDEIRFIVLKSHKERFQSAERLSLGRAVSVVGIRKRLRMIICTKLKVLDKGIDHSKQMTLV
jgi:tRNA(Ile2) C34 agmatinyltransferase TiaS